MGEVSAYLLGMLSMAIVGTAAGAPGGRPANTERGLLIVGRAQQAALAGDVATAADLLDFAAAALLASGQSRWAARALLDLAQLADELGEPVRRRRAVERAREALARATDRTEPVRAAEIFLEGALGGNGPLDEAIARSRTMLGQGG